MKADSISSPSQMVNGAAGGKNCISDGSLSGDFMLALMAAMIQQGTGFDSGTGSNGDYLLQQGQPTSGGIPGEVVGTVVPDILNEGIPEVIPVQGKGRNMGDGILLDALSKGNMLLNAVIPEEISGIPFAEQAGIKPTVDTFFTNNLTGQTTVTAGVASTILNINNQDPAVSKLAMPLETGQKVAPVLMELIETTAVNPAADDTAGQFTVKQVAPDTNYDMNSLNPPEGKAPANPAINDNQAVQQDNRQIQALVPDKVLKDASANNPELEQDLLNAAAESQPESQNDISRPDSNKKVQRDSSSFLKGESVEALKSAGNIDKESPDNGFTGKDGNQGEEIGTLKPGKYLQGDAQINSGTINFTSITAKKFPAEIVPYVLNAVRNSAGDNSRVTVLKLKLEPENMGEIKIRLSYSRGELTAHFFTTSGMVKEAVEFSLPQLRETLSQYNIDLGEAAAYVGQEQQNNSSGKYSGYRYSGTSGDLGGSYQESLSGDTSNSPGNNERALDLLI